MVEGPGPALSYAPANLTFQAGVPVVLTLQNAGGNGSKHYYSAPAFYKTVAWRKAQTSQAEYKAPYFKAFELLIGGSIDLYFVPVVPGTYPVTCTISGHAAAGMTGTITVTGPPATLDQEISPTWNAALENDGRTSGSHVAWTTSQQVQVDMVETVVPTNLAYSTVPQYAVGQGYVLRLTNPAGNVSKHYYTAAQFFETCVLRKAQDADAEIKAPYLKAVELLFDAAADKSLDMYVVPTVAGNYQAVCTIAGHEAGGMAHTFTVDAVGTTASSLVSAAVWPPGATHTVTMGEAPYAYIPATLNMVAGTPVVLRLTNPAANVEKHYFIATEFFKTVAWRKAQTSHGEYKAPYFKAFEMKTGASDTNIDLYFVPQIPGTYKVYCSQPGHEAGGMVGSIVVTGAAANSLDLEVSGTWDNALDTDPRTSGGHSVWTTAQNIQIDMVETVVPTNLAYSQVPAYTANQGYILKLRNPLGNTSKHYYTATQFYETCVIRKAQDTDAEIKVPYMKAVELLVSGVSDRNLEMFIVPTVAGGYTAVCTIAGHTAGGMTHTFTVAP